MSGWLAIVNRHSGGSGARARLPNILRNLSDLVEKTVFTEYPGHAAELAMDATSYSGLAAVGGDGTLFEILKGLDRKRQCIAIIPAGRGNSLARDLGLLGKPPRLDVIDASDPLHIDLMEVTFKNGDGLEVQNVSASTVALGYPAAVAKAALGFPRRFGKFSYAAAAALVRPVPFDLEISREDGSPQKTSLKFFIANNTRHAANFLVSPGANCRDGFIDLLELDAGFLAQTFHNVSALLGSGLFRRNHLSRAKSIHLRLQEPQELMIDGEILPDIISVRIQILPLALACIHSGMAT
jgi:diacylglycerol kinase (ATP)